MNRDTHRFCEFLLKKCESLRVRVLRNSVVTAVHTHEDPFPLKAVSVSSGGSSQLTDLKCTNLVISAGLWLDRVFKFLFPFAKVQIPLNVTGASGNHLLIRTPNWKPSDDDSGCDQVYLDNMIVGGATLDVSTLLGGTMYVGGYGADPEELPALATQVEPQPNLIKAMKELVAGFLNLDEGESVEVLREGRCYRPEATVGRPIIARVPLKLLFGEDAAKVGEISDLSASADIDGHGGVFVNTGHDSDGVTLGPGSGKVMAELIRGVETSVDISALGLPT